jgi:hypothetical protein
MSEKRKSNTYELCNNASRISISVNPFLTAPLICVPNSVSFPCAVSIPITNRLLSLNARPGLVHNDPQAASYIYHSSSVQFLSRHTPPLTTIESHEQWNENCEEGVEWVSSVQYLQSQIAE